MATTTTIERLSSSHDGRIENDGVPMGKVNGRPLVVSAEQFKRAMARLARQEPQYFEEPPDLGEQGADEPATGEVVSRALALSYPAPTLSPRPECS